MKGFLDTLKSEGTRLVFGVLTSLIAWFSSQIYYSLQEIQRQFIIMDKRVASIEQSRAALVPQLDKLSLSSEDVQKRVDLLAEKMAVVQAALQRHKIY